MRHDDPPRRRRAPAYQLELGTKSLLALFFALAIVCGMFFAFGYTLGKHAIPATFRLGETPQSAAAALTPAPGVQPPNPVALGQAESNQTPTTLTPGAASATPGTDTSSAAAPTPAAPGTDTTTAGTPPESAADLPAAIGAAAGNVAPPPGGASGQTYYQVQVFAGVQADAQSLAIALEGRGYPVSLVPPTPGEDNLYRVQVGPYLTLPDAKAASSRLTADGYPAVVKAK